MGAFPAQLFLPGSLTAQITGQVIVSGSLEPVASPNIMVPGTSVGTIGSRTGHFRLEWYSYPVRLQVTAIGFETRIVTIFESTSQLIVEMEPKVYTSDEVLVSHERIDVSNLRTRPIPVTNLSAVNFAESVNTSAIDLLRSGKGVYVQQTTVGQGSVYIRGRAGRDVLYLFNGLRLNPSFVRAGQNQYFGVIDPFSTEQISVYRGPVSVYHGSDALSGGLNVEPVKLPYTQETIWSGHVRSQFNFGATGEKTGNAGVGYQSDQLTWYLGGTFRDFSYYRMSDDSRSEQWFPYDVRLDQAGYRQFSYLTSLRYKIDSRNQVTFTGYSSYLPEAPRIDQMILGYARQTDPDITSPAYAYASNTYPLMFSAHSVSFKSAMQHPWMRTANIKFGYHVLSDHRKMVPFEVAPDVLAGNTFSVPSFRNEYDRNRSDQILLSLDFLATPLRSMIIRWGSDLSLDHVSSERYRTDTRNNARNDLLPRYPDGSRYFQSGVFVHGTQNIHPQIWLEAGSRFSYIHADLPLEGTQSARGFDPYRASFSQITGSVGLTWSPIQHLYLTSNMSTGFRAPNVADLTELGERRSRFMIVPNPDLKPEKTLNLDISARWINNRVNAEITGYRVLYTDKIESVRTGNIITRQLDDSGATIELLEITNRNENTMLLYGIESSFDLKISEGWASGLVFNYTFGELHHRGGGVSPVDRIPPANGQVYLRTALTERIRVGSRVRFALDHARLSDLEREDFRISNTGTDGFWVLQMFGSWDFESYGELRVLVDNLTDRAYREHGSSLDGNARNVTLTYLYRF